MSTVGRRLLSAVVEKGSVQDFIKMKLGEELFRDSEVELYKVIANHLSKYGKLPKQETILSMDAFNDALIPAPEPADFYLHEVEQRYLNSTLKDMVAESVQLLQKKKGDETLVLVRNAIGSLFSFQNRQHLFDLRHMDELVGNEYLKTKTSIDSAVMMYGWPTLDDMTGGLRGGDLASFVGRPAAGKTFKLLKVAQNSWITGGTPLFVSMEMNTTIISQRVAALHTKSPLTKLLKGEMSSPSFKKMMDGLVEVTHMGNPFWVVDGNFTTTADDIVNLCQQLKPTGVFVDGAYLLKHKDKKMNKFERIADNCEQLKQRVATDMDLPTVASYQLNRDVLKKKKEQKAGLEDIYGSDAIGQLSTVVLGLFQEEGVETMHQRRVEILKGRNGEVGEFIIHWEFEKMNFDEILPTEKPQPLGFIN